MMHSHDSSPLLPIAAQKHQSDCLIIGSQSPCMVAVVNTLLQIFAEHFFVHVLQSISGGQSPLHFILSHIPLINIT
jgi:hypothetical protein